MKTRKNVRPPLSRMKVRVKVLLLHDQNAAAAYAALDMGDGVPVTAEATGSAKREQGDTRDDMIAANLAVGRALVKLGHQLQETGQDQVMAAMISSQKDREAGLVRRLRRSVAPAAENLMPLSEIREEWGADAADRAASRRQPRGRHARKNTRNNIKKD
jgi:hypothetical protein